MAPRDRRLRRARDFAAVWRSRWVIRHGALTLRAVRAPDSPGRVGYVVAKTVAKHAVVRNKVKRRLRSIVARQTIPAGLDLAFVVQRPALTLSFQELTHVVTSLLSQALAGPGGRRRY